MGPAVKPAPSRRPTSSENPERQHADDIDVMVDTRDPQHILSNHNVLIPLHILMTW